MQQQRRAAQPPTPPPPQQFHAAAYGGAASHHYSPAEDANNQALEAAEKYKTELCRKFSMTGFCRYADMCQFAHGPHELRPLIRHPLYKTSLCKSYSTTHSCRYGTRCRFIHDETPEELAAVPRGIASVNLSVSAPSWDEFKEANDEASAMGRFPDVYDKQFEEPIYRFPVPPQQQHLPLPPPPSSALPPAILQAGGVYDMYSYDLQQQQQQQHMHYLAQQQQHQQQQQQYSHQQSPYNQPLPPLAHTPTPKQPSPGLDNSAAGFSGPPSSPNVAPRNFAAEAPSSGDSKTDSSAAGEASLLFAPVNLDARQLPVARTTIGLSSLAGRDSSSASLARQDYTGSLRQSSSLPLLSNAWPSTTSLVLGLPPTSPVLSPTLGSSKRNNSQVTFDPAVLPESRAPARTPPGLPRASTLGEGLDKSGSSRLAIFRNISDQDLSRLTASALSGGSSSSAVKAARPPLASARLPSFERLSEGSSVGLRLSDHSDSEETGGDDNHGLNF